MNYVELTNEKKGASPIFRSQESEFLLKLRQSIPPLKGAFARFCNGRCNLAAENYPESISKQNHVLAALEFLEHSPRLNIHYEKERTAKEVYI